MRRLLRRPSALAAPFRVVRALNDERNARRLARHLHCSLPDARTLYRLSRRDGYGAAYEAVFPNGIPAAQDASTSGDRAAAAERDGSLDPPVLQAEVSQAPPA